MNNLRISTRLAVACDVMVLLLIALGAVSLIRSTNQRTELKDVIDVRIQITRALGTLTDRVNVQAIQLRNLAIFTTEAVVKSSMDQITASRAEVDAQYKTLDSLITSANGKELLARMQQRRAEFAKIGVQYLGEG